MSDISNMVQDRAIVTIEDRTSYMIYRLMPFPLTLNDI